MCKRRLARGALAGMRKRRTLRQVSRPQKEHAAIENYHAVTSIAPSQPSSDEPDDHAITPTKAHQPVDEPEPRDPEEQPAALVNTTLEELARERRAAHA